MTLLRWRHLGMGAVVLGLLALGAPGLVEARKDEKPAAKEKEAEQVDVTDLGTAFQLVEYGEAAKALESLIMAAGLLGVAARAELKELDVKVEVEGVDKDKAKEPKAVTKPDLKKEAKDLIDEAEVMIANMTAKQKKTKTTLLDLIKVLEDRKSPTDGAGVVKYVGRTVEGGQTHILKLKATADEGTDLAIRSNSPVLVSVIRVDNGKVLAATLTPGGNLHFEPNVSEGTVSRGGKGGKVKKTKPHDPHHGHHRHHHKPRCRGITPDGDCPIIIRITNPTDQPIEYTLFLN